MLTVVEARVHSTTGRCVASADWLPHTARSLMIDSDADRTMEVSHVSHLDGNRAAGRTVLAALALAAIVVGGCGSSAPSNAGGGAANTATPTP